MIVIAHDRDEAEFLCELMDVLERLSRMVTTVEYITEVHDTIDGAEMSRKSRFFNAGGKRRNRRGISVHVRKYHGAHSG
jgi:hypothetical protein